MNQTIAGIAACAALLAGPSAMAQNLAKGDQDIVAQMAMANMAEVEMGKLAQAKASSAQVKTFAQQMIDDHTKALGEVQALATAKGVTLPAALDAKHKAKADKLSALSGEAFDKAYMKDAGVHDHQAVTKKLNQWQVSAKDQDIKALAGKMLPTVQQHLHSAEQLHGGKTTKSGKPVKPSNLGDATEHAQGKPTH
jgi:putative membrane protein